MVPALANELVLDVLELAFYNPPSAIVKPLASTPPRFRKYGTADVKSLRDCSLVSKQWSSFAQAVLFRNVTLTTRSQLYDFAAAVTKAPFLGEYVRSLTIQVPDEGVDKVYAMMTDRELAEEERALSCLIAGILVSCPRLYELKLNYSYLSPLDAEWFKLLRNSPPSITSLDIFNRALAGTSHWTVVGQLLEALPSLQHLALRGNTPPSPLTHYTPRFQLTSFIWDNWSAKEGGAMRHVLQSSVDSLQTLIFRWEPEPAVLGPLLKTFQRTLKDLAFWSCDPTTMDGLAEALGGNHYLDCVTSPQLSIESFETMTIPSRSVLEALPATVTSISFCNSYLYPDLPLRDVLEWIATQKNLRQITYRWSGNLASQDVSELETICKDEDIELMLLKWY